MFKTNSMKKCAKCKIEKPETEFGNNKSSKDGLHSYCKECENKCSRDKYYNNREKKLKQLKDKYQNDIEFKNKRNSIINTDEFKNKRNENARNKRKNNEEYREKINKQERDKYNNKTELREKKLKKIRDKTANDSEFREKESKRKKEYHATPKGKKVLKRAYSKYINKPENKMIRTIRDFIHRTLKYKNETYTNKDLGYTKHELKEHLEKQFDENMSWDNYGIWHVDHIIPITKFDKTTPIYVINHLENLQPLDGTENMSKNNRIELLPERTIGEYVLFLNENNKYQLK
jgi:hypothetical protein